jgi:aubergine-like protein
MLNNLTPIVPTTERIDDVNNTEVEVRLATNFFRIKTKVNNAFFYKYRVEFDQPVPEDSVQLRRSLYRQVKKPIEELLGLTIFSNKVAYCKKLFNDEPLRFPVKTTTGDKYEMCLTYSEEIGVKHPEALALFKRFVDHLVTGKKLVYFKNYLLDPKSSSSVVNRDFEKWEIWPGFNFRILNRLDANDTLLNLSMLHKVIRPESVQKMITRIMSMPEGDYEENVRKALNGRVVVTKYSNGRSYRINDVDFDRCPNDEFDTNEGPMTYITYYQKKHNIKLDQKMQPLLTHINNKNQTIYLVPELCFLTGLTTTMRDKKNLMEGTNRITTEKAKALLKEGLDRIKSLLDSKTARDAKTKWDLDIDTQPVQLTGKIIRAGEIKMLKENFDANNLHQNVLQPMLKSPKLKNPLVICNREDKELARIFISHLEAAISTFKYQIEGELVLTTTKNNNLISWETAIREKSTQTNLVLLILPGDNGNGANYAELKRLLKTDLGIPSQAVLTSTLTNVKVDLKSVANKILIQICAKVGGVPWGIQMENIKNRTMVVGINVYEMSNVIYIACVASVNKEFTQFVTILKQIKAKLDDTKAIAIVLKQCIAEAKIQVSLTSNIVQMEEFEE